MRILLALGLLGLGTADAVWLNTELLPQLRHDHPSAVEPPGTSIAVASVSAPAAPVVEGRQQQDATDLRAPSVAAQEPEEEIVIVEDEAPAHAGPSYDALQESLQAVGPIRFATGRTDVSGSGERQLRSAAELLDRAPDLRLEVRGHSDQKGDSTLNRRLARARAVAVQRALVDLGVASERITISSAGTREPLRRGSDSASLAANRRVELRAEKPRGPK